MRIEGFFVEPSLKGKKWLLFELGKNIDTLTSKYDNIILLGYFNTEPTDASLSNFCEVYNLTNLIKDKTCLKNSNKASCVDLIITNRPKRFQNSVVIETGLSDFHKMYITVTKMYYSKHKHLLFIIVNSRIRTMMLLQRTLRHFYQDLLMEKQFLFRQ